MCVCVCVDVCAYKLYYVRRNTRARAHICILITELFLVFNDQSFGYYAVNKPLPVPSPMTRSSIVFGIEKPTSSWSQV